MPPSLTPSSTRDDLHLEGACQRPNDDPEMAERILNGKTAWLLMLDCRYVDFTAQDLEPKLEPSWVVVEARFYMGSGFEQLVSYQGFVVLHEGYWWFLKRYDSNDILGDG